MLLVARMLVYGQISRTLGGEQINVATPLATEIARYDRTSVGCFNGTPNIEIPIYNAKIRDLNLPISLKYNASGIRVNQYPTWVGLGWNLNAGGMITRIVNCLPDEIRSDEIVPLPNVAVPKEVYCGYFYTSKLMDSNDWSRNLGVYANRYSDSEPDEFIVNCYGISASFYFYRDKNDSIKYKIKTNNGRYFRICPPVLKERPMFDIEGQPFLDIKNMFYEFTLIADDGTKLIFGGEDDAIELCTSDAGFSGLGEDIPSSGELTPRPARFQAKATSWMIKKIISPKGNEIKFSYKRNGNPLILNDVLTRAVTSKQSDGPSGDSDRGKSVQILCPTFLNKIEFNDNFVLTFYSSKSNELSTVRKEDEKFLKEIFMPYAGTCYDPTRPSTIIKINLAAKNFFVKLDSMIVKSNDEILSKYAFSYLENESERLKLKSISINDRNDVIDNKFCFEYNSCKLPVYNSTLTDNWGYYNNKNYRGDNEFVSPDFFYSRLADLNYTKAESLKKISYPTGGETEFVYELNDYSQIANQWDGFGLIEKTGNASGLRIKKIINKTDNDQIIQSYEYKNEDGSSSGILSDMPFYNVSGHQHISICNSGWDGLMHYSIKNDYNLFFDISSERYVNMLATTQGNDVTYSRVVENIGTTNPLKKIYKYTNHDTNPDMPFLYVYTNFDSKTFKNHITSDALERGLLTSETWLNGDKKVKEVTYVYNDDPNRYNNYIKTVSNYNTSEYLFTRLSSNRIFTFYPYLKKRTEVLFDKSGASPISVDEEIYKYNDDLLSVLLKKNINNKHVLTKKTIYPKDCLGGSHELIYNDMLERNMINYPIEIIENKDDKVINSTLTEYVKRNNIIVPYRCYKFSSKEPLDSIEFKEYDGINMDSRYILNSEILKSDIWGNPLEVVGANNLTTTYLWAYNGKYPIAEIKNGTYNKVQNILGSTFLERVSTSLDLLNDDWEKINNLRSLMNNVLIKSYVYKPFIGLIHVVDEKNVNTFFEYDFLGRLIYHKDAQGNLLKKYNYHYLNEK